MSYIAYCGLLCNECSIYIASQNNDLTAKEKLAAECSGEGNLFTAEDMTCEGCFWVMNDRSKMCGDCEIRNCAGKRNVENCGLCPEYPCAIIERRLPYDSDGRIRLDLISLNII